MRNLRLYSFLALMIVISLAITSSCATVTAPDKAPAVSAVSAMPATPVITTASVTAVTGSPDLVITKVWLDGLMIYYTIKNIGVADSPPTYSYIYVNDLLPIQGSSSYVNALKPGEEQVLTFSNYQWPFSFDKPESQARVDSRGFIELPLDNNKVRICADAQNQASETSETNNCKVTLIGKLWDYDLLSVSNLATWRNSDGDLPEPGSENDVHGAHFQVPNRDMEVTPQLEMIPQQIPRGWMQGIFGYFYSDYDWGSPKTAAIKIPAKLHFAARVGLSNYATGSDGVTFKVGLKDLNDNVTWIASKKVTTPGAFENWDVNLNDYEGQKYYFLLRVEAGDSPVNDFAIWNQARLMQVND